MTWPFENDTSAITKKLANRSIKADKRRNIFIIVTIAFAACLMTVLALYTFGKSHELKTFLQVFGSGKNSHYGPGKISQM